MRLHLFERYKGGNARDGISLNAIKGGGRGSRVAGRGARVAGRGSRVAGRGLRVAGCRIILTLRCFI